MKPAAVQAGAFGMSNGNSRQRAALAAVALLCAGAAPASAADASRRPAPGIAVETVYFAGPHPAAVNVMRGLPSQPPAPNAARVKVVRGAAAIPVSLPSRAETVSFADAHLPSVTVLRGPVQSEAFAADLFGPASEGDLDRVAFAVDGIESRHGADPRMWRPEFDGPQGPMQVSAAAALDVGGGDRFDLRQNRLLGRAYLAQMFRRYGNWPDALAAYNWGPGNLDQWIAAGRDSNRLPPIVAYYISRVLRDALITTAARH